MSGKQLTVFCLAVALGLFDMVNQKWFGVIALTSLFYGLLLALACKDLENALKAEGEKGK